jgi:spermidine dehydrogenase
LRSGYFFEKETFGVDRLVAAPPGRSDQPSSNVLTADYLRHMPISEQAKRDVLRLLDPAQPDYLAGLTSTQKKQRLARMSYKDFLIDMAKVDPQAYWFYLAFGRAVFCVGADATPALFAWQMGETAGFGGLNLDPSPEGLLAGLPGGQHGRQTETRPSRGCSYAISLRAQFRGRLRRMWARPASTTARWTGPATRRAYG